MRANCSDPHRPRGFTVIELVAVIVLMALLAVAVLPKMDAMTAMRGAAWRDQVLMALRHAHATATSHRRLVCVSVATGAVTLTIAGSNPATSCGGALPGPDGNADWARDPNAPATTVSPAGVLYVQPTGRVTTGGSASSAVADRSISIVGETAISVVGETGHVE